MTAELTVVLDGLVFRRAGQQDRDALVELFSTGHAAPDGTPNHSVGAWVGDLFDRGHPTYDLDDVSVVEDPGTGELVSSLMLVPQTWCYDGVPFGVGRVELGATHPEYQRRGLFRLQLKLLHQRSTERGDLLQAATDLLFFHGEHGYHSALTQRLGHGGVAGDLPPASAVGEPVRLRPATLADVGLLTEIDRPLRDRVLLSCPRGEAEWTLELTGRSQDSMVRDEILVIESGQRPVGYLLIGYGGIPTFPIPDWLPGLPCPENVVSVSGMELLPGVSWFDVVPGVLRQLTAERELDGYLLWLGTEHPAYRVLGRALTRHPPGVGWFLRVPDLPAFLRQVTPVLERRLRHSAAAGFSGSLRIHLYTQGIELTFVEGSLRVASWAGYSRRASDVSLPEQMFLQLLFGHADFDEIAPAFPDCRLQTSTGALLVRVLFPKQDSRIWPLV